MQKGSFFQVLLAVMVTITLSSCSSTQLAKLDGDWQVFYLEHLEDENIYIWNFGAESVFTITKFSPPSPTNPNPTPSLICRGRYRTKAEFTKAVIHISDLDFGADAAFQQLSMLEFQTYSADWTILEIDDDVMRLGTADTGGYVIREFTRIN